MDHLEDELKKEFQLERMILFSDAVFAIAITLLILDIKIPELTGQVSNSLLLDALTRLIPRFIGFLISFFLIGLYWTIHHRLFGFVINYNRKLLWLNLFFLLTIITMPFSSGFYGEYSGSIMFEKNLIVPMAVYVFNVCATGFFNFWLWNYIGNPANHIAHGIPGDDFLKMAKIRALIVPFAFLTMLVIACLKNIYIAVTIPILIPVCMWILRKIFERKHKKISPQTQRKQ